MSGLQKNVDGFISICRLRKDHDSADASMKENLSFLSSNMQIVKW